MPKLNLAAPKNEYTKGVSYPQRNFDSTYNAVLELKEAVELLGGLQKDGIGRAALWEELEVLVRRVNDLLARLIIAEADIDNIEIDVAAIEVDVAALQADVAALWAAIAALPPNPDPASTTEVLAGTNTTKFVTPDSLNVRYESGGSLAASISGTTLTLPDGGFGFLNYTGTIDTIVTASPSAAGRRFVIICSGGAPAFVHSTNLQLPDAVDFTMKNLDVIELIQSGGSPVQYRVLNRNIPFPATTTEILTGTETDRPATSDAIAALWEKGSDVAAATSMSLGEGGYFVVTGSGVTINQITFATAKNGRRAILHFNGANTIAHNVGGVLCPGAVDLAVGGGDLVELICTQAGTPVYVVSLFRRTAVGLSAEALASTTDVLTGTNATKAVTPDALAALWEQGADVAAAATLVLGEGGFFVITGSTGITDIDFGTASLDGRHAWLRFTGAPLITHNATTLNILGGANWQVAAGDKALVLQDHADNVWLIPFPATDKPLRRDEGTYTPGYTNIANISAATAFLTNWFRVGNAVHVWGKAAFDMVTGADTFTQIKMTLPVAASFSTGVELSGTISSALTSTKEGYISTNGTTEATISFISNTTSNLTFFFMLSYTVG